MGYINESKIWKPGDLIFLKKEGCDYSLVTYNNGLQEYYNESRECFYWDNGLHQIHNALLYSDIFRELKATP